MRPHRRQPTRLPRPWDSPGKNTGVGCHVLLQCVKVKSESEVAQSCLTLHDPVDCSPPGSSVRGVFQARVLGWGAVTFSVTLYMLCLKDSRNKVFWWAVIRFSFHIFFFLEGGFDLLTFANFLGETDSIIRISKNQLCPPLPHCSKQKWALVVSPVCTSFREGRNHSLTTQSRLPPGPPCSAGILLGEGERRSRFNRWERSYRCTCFGILLRLTHLLK